MSQCMSCCSRVVKPYIKCAQCPSLALCLYCFASGCETLDHRNDHRYEVIKDDFCLFDADWSAAEELKLLEAISECGFDNWVEVADIMRYKTSDQCEKHYEQFYLVNPQPPLPDVKAADITYFPCPLPCKASVNPPRPAEDSVQQAEMSGYCAARSDFSIEHNNFAELDIKDVAFSECDGSVDNELQLAMLKVYRNILKERQRRKLVVKQFGLIDMNRHIAECRRYERVLGVKSMESLRRLSQLFTSHPLHWDLCLEALTYETTLRQRILELQKYRMAGLRCLQSGKMLDRLVNSQQANERHLLSDVLRYMKDSFQSQPYTHKKTVFDKISKGIDIGRPQPPRKTAPPLEISSLPGCERLTASEKQLCSRVRLVPEAYLDFKRLLVTENNKHGFLRLAQARSLVKIDVNKTRKIYDFLISEGFVNAYKNK